MPTYPEPVVVLSRCLEQDACRYNGQVIRDGFVRELAPWVEFRATCPEVEIGLGVPRDPIQLVRAGEDTRLVQPSTGRDLTSEMHGFSDRFLGGLDGVDGFILKSRSPSCGVRDAKVHGEDDPAPITESGTGLFARRVLERFGDVAVEDEVRLRDPQVRHHFLTQLFTFAAFRSVQQAPSMRDIVAFQARNKLLFMAHNQTGVRRLGEIVGNAEALAPAEVAARYRDELVRVLARPARPGAWVNVAQHAFGYFSDHLSTREKTFFQTLLDEYRGGRQPLQSLLTALSGWLSRIEAPYLEAQSLFEPYPAPLVRLEHH